MICLFEHARRQRPIHRTRATSTTSRSSVRCAASNNFFISAYGEFMDALPPSSRHPGGINICFADGSVRFLKNSISMITYCALGSRAGGEVVSADAY